ncbi:MAG TPA: hypothetical protein VJU15_06250 [Gemmatimonadales bacterium]|nr:hypothetical protein [Gemmatimonadales bacterium]
MPWASAPAIAAAVLVLGVMTFVLDAAARRASKRVLATRAKDLPPLPAPDGDRIAVFEPATFSDDVGAAVVRLAEREPVALDGIARAAARVV